MAATIRERSSRRIRCRAPKRCWRKSTGAYASFVCLCIASRRVEPNWRASSYSLLQSEEATISDGGVLFSIMSKQVAWRPVSFISSNEHARAHCRSQHVSSDALQPGWRRHSLAQGGVRRVSVQRECRRHRVVVELAQLKAPTHARAKTATTRFHFLAQRRGVKIRFNPTGFNVTSNFSP